VKRARVALRKASAKLSKAKARKNALMGKLGHRAVVVHRQNVHEAGQAAL
jgi:hypothetical protein